MNNEERKQAGMLWIDTKAASKAQIQARCLAYDFNHLRPDKVDERKALLKEMLGHVGEDVWIEQPFTIAYGKTVSIGDRSYANSGLTLVDDYTITIGNDVLIAPNVTITATGHPLHYKLRPHGDMYSFPVVIEDGVWIGSNVTICPGVTIGEHSVIAAGSVVTRDVPANTLAGGVPCKVIREITDHDLEDYYHDLKVSTPPDYDE